MMNFQKIVVALTLVSFLAVGCNNEAKKEETPQNQEVAANIQEASFAISGMTCEIGCAKKIASDLNKKEGVLEANVVFNDSIANVKFDANKTNKAELMAFVDGIGDNMYKTSKICEKDCKKECGAKTDAEAKACKTNCKMPCCNTELASKKCEMKCCADKTDAEKANCEMECCEKNTTTEKSACKKDCTMACCAETKKA
ncbi:heavy-metal-associated domain-containing protein [Tenacibaculum tangerinum]|uniref:Heavy-metal-associated domain-containing protein n=1 Tax=Tenacibaculum tangerinum TaxID=3038772 RepID=A0ABY8L3Y4_9FLAO|nr:heavy-metal-associated domain-containing protein [Tenacibaculum tangerinum]WGH74600.1 heavy-metal-associated domain-containing protein [Tenacibaculum tangerinum]